MLPEAYNSNIQFQQGPGYVAILQEEIHDIRIIPLDGRPHLGPRIRQLMGDSRGRWEGNTLAVDTTNFTDTTNFRGSGENLHVVERFTRVDEETIRYEFTVEDPTTWTRPWKAELSMVKTKGPIFEFACHEGNYGLANNLSGARAQEKEEAKAAERLASRDPLTHRQAPAPDERSNEGGRPDPRSRSTAFSPYCVGSVETRMSSATPPAFAFIFPSCGIRCWAISSFARILMREINAVSIQAGRSR